MFTDESELEVNTVKPSVRWLYELKSFHKLIASILALHDKILMFNCMAALNYSIFEGKIIKPQIPL